MQRRKVDGSYPISSRGTIYRTCPIMQESKPYWTYQQREPNDYFHLNDLMQRADHKRYLTHIQKKKAISKAFWKRMKWIKKRTMPGRLNQKCSSDGLTISSPCMATCFSATSWANWVITCSNLVPTARRSWKTDALFKLCIGETKDWKVKE